MRFLASVLLFFVAVSAQAAPNLVVLQDNGSTNPVYRRVIESLGAVIVANNLGKHYDHIDMLTGENATKEKLFETIRRRGARRAVDVIVLSHGDPGELILTKGNLTDSEIRAAGPLKGLRMVYMMACYSSSIVEAWKAAGAKLAIGHQDVNSLPGFYFPHFLKRWAEGASALEAAALAHKLSTGVAGLLRDYVQETELLNATGIARSEPVLTGVDIDRMGHTFPARALKVEPSVLKPRNSSARTYRHTDFEKTVLELMSASMPQSPLNIDAFPSAQQFLKLVGPAAWQGLRDAFPALTAEGSSLESGGALDKEIWIDGDALRYFLSPLRQWAGDRLDALLDRIQGARLIREANHLRVAFYFEEELTFQLQPESAAPNWEPYAIEVPRAVRFNLSMLDGTLFVSGLADGRSYDGALRLKLKLPYLPDSVYLRSFSADLTNGNARVEAGVLGDSVTVVAKGQLLAQRIDGVDVWETIRRNLDFLLWPAFRFSRL